MTNKEKAAEILLDAMGQIDDRFIYEAESASPQKTSASLFRRLAVVGLSVALAFTVAVSSLVGALIHNAGKGNGTPPEKDPSEADQSLGDTDLADTFISLKPSTSSMATNIDEVDLFDGTSKIIWKYSHEESYRVCEISTVASVEISRMLSEKSDFTEVKAADESNGFEGIWISFGDGLVYSPCLKTSAGNVGVGTLFDYEPELEPSRQFIEALNDAISEGK